MCSRLLAGVVFRHDLHSLKFENNNFVEGGIVQNICRAYWISSSELWCIVLWAIVEVLDQPTASTYPEYGDDMFFRNISNHLQHYMS